MRVNYECRTCGYEPDQSELAKGTCPRCSGIRLRTWKALPAILEALPVGSSIQVLVPRYDRQGQQYEATLFLWTLSERDTGGKALWRGHVGRSTFTDALGLEREVYVQQYAETQHHDPLCMTSDAVAHFTVGEMTYGAWYVIHDTTQTTQTQALQRLMEDMGWPPATTPSRMRKSSSYEVSP